jgi:hypothetical protein
VQFFQGTCQLEELACTVEKFITITQKKMDLSLTITPHMISNLWRWGLVDQVEHATLNDDEFYDYLAKDIILYQVFIFFLSSFFICCWKVYEFLQILTSTWLKDFLKQLQPSRGYEENQMSQWHYFRKWLHALLFKNNFFIQMNFLNNYFCRFFIINAYNCPSTWFL